MVQSFLESLKYVGHLWPVALLRMVIGYHFVRLGLSRIDLGYLKHAYISEKLSLYEVQSVIGSSYFEALKFLVREYWLLFSYALIGIELIIGISYIFGYCVRFSAVLGVILAINMMWFFDFTNQSAQSYVLYFHVLFLLLGAGRCLGVDYHFYKSRRGLFW